MRDAPFPGRGGEEFAWRGSAGREEDDRLDDVRPLPRLRLPARPPGSMVVQRCPKLMVEARVASRVSLAAHVRRDRLPTDAPGRWTGARHPLARIGSDVLIGRR